MLFWPIFVSGLILLAFFLSGRPPSDLLLPGQGELQYIYTIVLGVGAIFGFGLRIAARAGLRNLLLGCIWATTLAAGVGFATLRGDVDQVLALIRGEPEPTLALSQRDGRAELRRGWDGHYRAKAMINGKTVNLMVDTGASIVLLPYEKAVKIGIDPATLRYSMPVTTANGRSTVAPIRLASIQIGSVVVRDVEAAVAHPGRLRAGLLGMSFLERLHETSFQGDKLILRQGPGSGSDRFQQAPVSN